ncbi:uncharacterized protein LOC132544082 [Ylistrum balloti]|uniref:uncharacterized protein LOC132544082 n=1 Tax=Ylistrum balloti TaxID=509963 RepID=UPI002905BEB7|nr:uncharacterized protein LOC132544082 [Ylistrum balloti]
MEKKQMLLQHDRGAFAKIRDRYYRNFASSSAVSVVKSIAILGGCPKDKTGRKEKATKVSRKPDKVEQTDEEIDEFNSDNGTSDSWDEEPEGATDAKLVQEIAEKVVLDMTKQMHPNGADVPRRKEVSSKDWPKCSIATDPKKGRIFRNKALLIRKGEIVCNYHGKHAPASQGKEALLKEVKDENANYITFYNDGGKQTCVNANRIPCECHPEKVEGTFGQLISHSRLNINCKPIQRKIRGKSHIFIQAVREFNFNEELLFDYGVRRAENGQRISWLDQ